MLRRDIAHSIYTTRSSPALLIIATAALIALSTV
jgi:hypothetical protein